MKIHIQYIIAICIAFAACNKNEHDGIPKPQANDTNINLEGSWHIDSVLIYSERLSSKENADVKPTFNAVDSFKFYGSPHQNLSFVPYPTWYCMSNKSMKFVLGIPVTTFPLPSYEESSHFWKQISNNKGFVTNKNRGITRSSFAEYIDKDTIPFSIVHNSNERIILILDPFIEYYYEDKWDDIFPFADLDGYYIRIYLTREK